MRKFTASAAALAALILAPKLAAQVPTTPLDRALSGPRVERIADSLLALMSLEEKLGQLSQAPGSGDRVPAVDTATERLIRQGRVGSLLSVYGPEVQRLQHLAVDSSRLHIPLLFGYDVIHGMRTIFPVPLAMASTFDPRAESTAARVAALEATALGVQWTFAPMVDIARDARWGRIVEGAGEDPFLGSIMAAAQVRGFQGEDADLRAPASLLATAKHFAAYGAAEAGRDYNVVRLSDRDLWDIYLPPFRAAVQAGAGTLMGSFNEIDGTPSHANDWLMTTVLRDLWHFRGFVVSDWTGIAELVNHGIGDSATVARRALSAGVDMEMTSDLYRSQLPAEIRAGRINAALVDTAVLRILRLKAALGLFDDPYHGNGGASRPVLTPEYRTAARAVALESIVLLTNRSVGGHPALPLRRPIRTLAVIGPLADDSLSALGPWNGAGRAADAVSVLAGLRAALPGTRILFERGVGQDTVRAQGAVRTPGIARAAALARQADAVILVLGETAAMSGEASSRADVGLPGAQLQLAQAVVRAVRARRAAAPVIAVLMNGRPLAVPWLADSASALVESWFLGVEHGPALAAVLLGDASPSGKLPVTFPRATGQEPMYYAHKMTGRPPADSIKWTSKYIDVPFTPQFPFGWGLSYTSFAYANVRVSADSVRTGDSIVVTADLTNTGDRSGTEIAQLYVRDDAASVTRPVRELRGFERATIAPGLTRALRFVLRADDLAMYDRAMRRVVEPGSFTVWVGGSSLASDSARFRVVGDTLVLAGAPPAFR